MPSVARIAVLLGIDGSLYRKSPGRELGVLPLPACGERVGVRGTHRERVLPIVPLTRIAARSDLSPQAGRGCKPHDWSKSSSLNRRELRRHHQAGALIDDIAVLGVLAHVFVPGRLLGHGG